MALDPAPIFDAAITHAQTLGVFEQVAGHPAEVSPGYGMVCDLAFADMATANTSGLANTAVRIEFAYTLYTALEQEPADQVDPQVLTAVGLLWAAIIADFTLGGLVRQVDVRGAHGERMRARGIYATVAGVKVRAVAVSVPVIVDGAFPEAP